MMSPSGAARLVSRLTSRLIFPGGAALIAVGIAGCGKAPAPDAAPPPSGETHFVATADMKQLMAWIIDPSADVVWGAVGTVITESGREDFAPKTDEEWAAIRNAAATVAEAGNLLMMPGRAVNQDDWIKKSRALIDTATVVVRAAEVKDAETLFTAGSDMYLACSACHAGYVFGGPAGSQEPPSQ
jgi:hypothetical protein